MAICVLHSGFCLVVLIQFLGRSNAWNWQFWNLSKLQSCYTLHIHTRPTHDPLHGKCEQIRSEERKKNVTAATNSQDETKKISDNMPMPTKTNETNSIVCGFFVNLWLSFTLVRSQLTNLISMSFVHRAQFVWLCLFFSTDSLFFFWVLCILNFFPFCKLYSCRSRWVCVFFTRSDHKSFGASSLFAASIQSTSYEPSEWATAQRKKRANAEKKTKPTTNSGEKMKKAVCAFHSVHWRK